MRGNHLVVADPHFMVQEANTILTVMLHHLTTAVATKLHQVMAMPLHHRPIHLLLEVPEALVPPTVILPTLPHLLLLVLLAHPQLATVVLLTIHTTTVNQHTVLKQKLHQTATKIHPQECLQIIQIHNRQVKRIILHLEDTINPRHDLHIHKTHTRAMANLQRTELLEL